MRPVACWDATLLEVEGLQLHGMGGFGVEHVRRSQGEGELVAIRGSRGVVGLELGRFALEGGVQGRELRDGFLGQGEAARQSQCRQQILRVQASELDLSLQAPRC